MIGGQVADPRANWGSPATGSAELAPPTRAKTGVSSGRRSPRGASSLRAADVLAKLDATAAPSASRSNKTPLDASRTRRPRNSRLDSAATSSIFRRSGVDRSRASSSMIRRPRTGSRASGFAKAPGSRGSSETAGLSRPFFAARVVRPISAPSRSVTPAPRAGRGKSPQGACALPAGRLEAPRAVHPRSRSPSYGHEICGTSSGGEGVDAFGSETVRPGISGPCGVCRECRRASRPVRERPRRPQWERSGVPPHSCRRRLGEPPRGAGRLRTDRGILDPLASSARVDRLSPAAERSLYGPASGLLWAATGVPAAAAIVAARGARLGSQSRARTAGDRRPRARRRGRSPSTRGDGGRLPRDPGVGGAAASSPWRRFLFSAAARPRRRRVGAERCTTPRCPYRVLPLHSGGAGGPPIGPRGRSTRRS